MHACNASIIINPHALTMTLTYNACMKHKYKYKSQSPAMTLLNIMHSCNTGNTCVCNSVSERMQPFTLSPCETTPYDFSCVLQTPPLNMLFLELARRFVLFVLFSPITFFFTMFKHVSHTDKSRCEYDEVTVCECVQNIVCVHAFDCAPSQST